MVMVSITGHISGGLVNPAVAFALWVAGKLSLQRTIVLIVAQLVGAVVASAAVRWIVGSAAFDTAASGAPVLGPTIDVGTGTVLEAILTFLLVFAVFGTAVDDRGPWLKTAGLTIGLVIAFEIMAFGPLTGAAMNPARWFGPALIGSQWANAIVWTVGPIAGGIIAAVVYTRVFLQGRAPATP
jgi:aquaporin Z